MVLELAVLNVKRGSAPDFERDFLLAEKYIMSSKGYLQHDLHKCLEVENQYLLLVQWESLEDHTIGFRQSDLYLEWKELLHHYYDPFPVVEHYEKVR